MRENIPVGFWKRLSARAIDLFIVAFFSVSLSFLFTKKNQKGITTFTHPSYFYIWSLITILLVFIFMIAVPLFTKGWSLGYKVMRIKVISKNIYKSILIRESFFGFAWIIIILMVITIINHTLISKLIEIKSQIRVNKTESPEGLNSWQKTRISLVGSMSGLVTFFQMFLAISIIPNKLKQGWHDRAAECQVIMTNKHKEVIVIDDIELKPIEINIKKYTWIKRSE